MPDLQRPVQADDPIRATLRQSRAQPSAQDGTAGVTATATLTDGELAAYTVEVALAPGRVDSAARRIAAQARELGLELPEGFSTRRGWSFRVRGGRRQAARLAESLLADPVTSVATVRECGEDPRLPGTRRLEVVRLPGVMDPSAQSIVRAATRLGLDVRDVRSWSAYVFDGDVPDALLARLGTELLSNAAIEELRLDPATGIAPVAELHDAPFRLVIVPLRDADAAELLRLSRDGCLALDAGEMAAVQTHFRQAGRDPTDLELDTIAQTWSEHCKHKTLTGLVEFEGEVIDNLLKSTIVRATRTLDRPFCRSVFVDNAGVVDFDERFHLTFKVETHNHPSAIEPYGGAGTGLGGVLRDTLGTGLGARPVASTDVFCFGPPDLPRERVPKGSLHPLRVMKGVVSGVRDYGNRMGIPTVNGAVVFDERYTANPVVYCGSIGLLPVDRLEKQVLPGDLVVVAGGRTGRDGIHGATFSSQELHEESETVSSGAVQIGNPIEEKKLMDALLRARDLGLYRGITDCGAGGLSSAVGEMGAECGAHVQLERVPLKYHGLDYREIWISEAQERMVFAVPPERETAFLALFAEEDVEATVIGRFTDTGRLVADHAGTRVMDLSMEFLHEGLPRRTRQAVLRARRTRDPRLPAAERAGALLTAMLAHPDVASKAWIIRQYDHEVQAGSAIKPLVGVSGDGPSDAAVVAPVPGSRRGFAVGCGLAVPLGDVDPYQMALHGIDEALRNVVAVGGDPAQTSILDNFSWGNCDRPENLGDLVVACRACLDGALAYGTPFISGKDSLNNEYREGEVTRSIPPTLLISALAIVPDVVRTTSMDLKAAGNELVLVGATGAELGGSLLARLVGRAKEGELGAVVPPVDLEQAPAVLAAVHALVSGGHVRACHDLSEGGLGVAAAEMAFAGNVGAELDLQAMPLRGAAPGTVEPLRRLFGESPTRFLLEVEPEALPAVRAALAGLPHARLGRTQELPRLVIRDGGAVLLDEPLETLRRAFLATLDLDNEHVAR